MFTLYAAPGACSHVPMMALEEAGAAYDLELVRLMRGQHKSPITWHLILRARDRF
jgi:glutathione S-transferase